MNKTLIALALVAGASLITAATASPAPSTTMEMAVTGLNCSLCSAEMKSKLKTIAGATDIEPRLMCGKVYLDMPTGSQLNESVMSSTLKKSGFTFDGLKPANKSMADVRKTAEDDC
jgi:copper chaperone CopZ